jgi:hypothetical protein
MRPLASYAKSLIAAILLTGIVPLSPRAERPAFWLEAKTGPSTFGGSFQSSLDIQTGSHLFKARFTWGGKLVDYGISDGNRTDRAYEVGLLYGLVARQDKVQFSAAAGLAYTDIRDYTTVALSDGQFDNTVQRHKGIGFPTELGFTYQFSPFVAFNTSLFANFNRQKSIAGMNFGLQFGALGRVGR